MTQKEKLEIAEIFSSAMQKDSQKHNVVDMGFKALSFIVTALVIWIFTVVSDTQKRVQEMGINSRYVQEQVGKLEEFSRIPRFTKENFDQNVLPLRTAIEYNSAILNQRKSALENADARINAIEDRISKIEYHIENGGK